MEALGQERQDIYERTVQLGLPCLYYPLTKIEGEENRIEDRSGYELHARVVMREGGQPPSFVAGAAGSAIDLKGESYVCCPESLRLMAFPHMEKGEVVNSISLTLLVRLPDVLDAPSHTYFCTHAREQGCQFERGYLFFWHFYTGRKKVVLRVPVATLLGNWVHVAWILDNGVLYASVNGVEHSSGTFAQIQPGICGGPFIVGGEYNSEALECSAEPSCRSLLQHFAVFPRRLSRDDIRAQMEAAGIRHG